jgi:hypothetical protein
MTPKNKALAIEIIAASNSAKVSFNVPVKDHYSTVYEILIHESNADLINKLIAAKFSLSMTTKGLSVEDYCVPR